MNYLCGEIPSKFYLAHFKGWRRENKFQFQLRISRPKGMLNNFFFRLSFCTAMSKFYIIEFCLFILLK